MKKFVSMMLAIVMVLSLAACGGGNTTPTTVPTEPTVPPTTTEPAPDALQTYLDAAKAIEDAASLLVGYTINSKMTIDSTVYEEKEVVSLSLLDPGTDAFVAEVSRDFTWADGYYANVDEAWGSGSFYSQLDGDKRTAEMTAEAFLARYLPAVLFTPDLYTTVEFADEGTITFSGATEFEPWLDGEGYTLVEAGGTAELTAAGALGDCTYRAVYELGGVKREIDITFRTRVGQVDPKLPEFTDQYLPVENVDAIIVGERAYGLMMQSEEYANVIVSSAVVQAGALTQTEQSTIQYYGIDSELAAEYDYQLVLADLSGQYGADTYTQNERFVDGVYSTSVNGGAAQEDPSVSASMMESYLLDELTQNFLTNGCFDTLSLTDLGAVSLLEATFSEEFSQEYGVWVTGAIYEDPYVIENAASDYRPDTGNYYIGIDNITGLPTMIGIEYVGVHTIDGAEYMLASELTQNYQFHSGEVYEDITGESLPVEEPAEQASPLLYRVTGANGEEMWLFGTIHVGDERMAYLPQTVLDALYGSDALAVEFDAGETTEQLENDPEYAAQIAALYLYTDGTTTADHISDAGLYQDAVQMMKATGSYMVSMQMFKPVILSNVLETSYLTLTRSLSTGFGADNTLMGLAKEADIEILSVESAVMQTEMLTGFSDALQELLLLKSMETEPYGYMNDVMALYEMWCRGDEAELIAYLSVSDEALADMTEDELALYEEYVYAMSTERNAGMLEIAKEYLSSGDVVFYAVGLAHLLEGDGLVNTLRDAGYTVELVPTK